MSGLAVLLLATYLGSAWAPGALHSAVYGAAVSEHLPIAGLEVTIRSLPHHLHEQDNLNAAFFDRRTEALWLYRPHFVSGWALKPPLELRVDSVEYLFHALAEAWLYDVLGQESELAGRLRSRAGMLYPQLADEAREEAYVDAAASFISHAISVANEIEGHRRRRAPGAPRLCQLLLEGRLLFALWEEIFDSGEYRGAYHLVDLPFGPSAQKTVVVPLAPEDKALLSQAAFAGRWSGDARADFESRICLPDGAGVDSPSPVRTSS